MSATRAIVDAQRKLGAVWALESHVCANCLARIVSRMPKGSREEPSPERVYRCTNCGASGHGLVRFVCACGMKYGGRDAGLRCAVNEERRPELLSEVIAREVVETAPAPRPRPKPAAVEGAPLIAIIEQAA